MQSAKSQVWAVVIARGAGEPARLVNTLRRVALEIPAARTVVVTMRSHARYFSDRRDRGESFLVQHDNRGTAASILLPVGPLDEASALHQAYALMRTASFSRAVLPQSVPMLAVARLTVGVLWSDLGHPGRALDVSRAL